MTTSASPTGVARPRRRLIAVVSKTAPDLSGESIDLAGTLEWTCGQALP
jgi:hypothetical protein